MKACSTVDDGRGVEEIFQILGINLSVPAPNDAWAYRTLKYANPTIWTESHFSLSIPLSKF